ncbi:hypothetical protein NQZ68_029792 [Dissostichus eleginoides]|nr:hypothetical protein NQZ68_029792 [Dissostichus eleginoides]
MRPRDWHSSDRGGSSPLCTGGLVGQVRGSLLLTDLALIEEVDPEAAISGPEEEDPEDFSPAGSPEAAVSGLGDKDTAGQDSTGDSTFL